MNITFAEQLHIDSLAYIVKATFHLACPEDSNRDLQSIYISNHLSAQNFQQFINSDNYKVWVAIEGKEPVGLAVMEIVSDKLATLSKLYVLPEAQGKGVAFRLYSNLVNHAKKSGYKKLNLSVYSGNLKAKAFYEKQGFKLIRDYDFVMETELHKDHIYEQSIV